MASASSTPSTSTIEPTNNPTSIYFLHPSDVGHKIITNVFDGSGYGDWQRAIILALSAKNKLTFVDGRTTKPAKDFPDLTAWRRANDVVIGCLLSSLEPSIAESVQWHKTAKEIWDELHERYGRSSNAQLYSLQEELGKLTQDPDETIADFYTKFKTIWDELDHLNPLPSCSCDECSCNLTQKILQTPTKSKINSISHEA